MAVIHSDTRGRDFTAEELIGQRIRIEGPVSTKIPPVGYAMMIIADDEMVNNVTKLELAVDPCSIIEAKLTLYHDETTENKPMTEEVTLRDNINVSFSSIVSEVQ
jgi:hypothetical protein